MTVVEVDSLIKKKDLFLHIWKCTTFPSLQKSNFCLLDNIIRTSLVVQWLKMCLPMQGTQVPSLVPEDPTCRGATKPVRHNYWACAPEPTNHNCWARVPQLLEPACPRACAPQQRQATAMRSLRTATKSSPCSPLLEKARAQQRRPNSAINK